MKINIKKEKIVMSITIGIACFALMLVMFMQFKVVQETNITQIENMRESELRKELSEWKEKYEQLVAKYDEVAAKILEYRNESESDEATTRLLESELEQLKIALGKTDVEGEGIEIVLEDKAGTKLSDDLEVYRIDEEDLLVIVNELFGAGAEAISINNQRIVAMSDITTIGDIFLRINGEKVVSPYVIRAIGNQTYLESAVFGKGGHVDELKELGHNATINKSKRIKIQKYSGEISTKYIN